MRARATHARFRTVLTGLVPVIILAMIAALPAGAPESAAPPMTAVAQLSGAQFQPGNIISDAQFYNARTMSAAAIQAFLAGQYSGCAKGYTCVRDYATATRNQPAEAGLCNGYTGRPSESAASIIANVATSCGVNPQVLLVLLQKESSLITTGTPNYQTSAGYGCPDSTGCASRYFGFFNQVYLAARQFKLYRLYPGNYNYVAGQSNYVLYNPNTKCGGSQVHIQNQATAGLYDYTPYQPNAAALANLRGTGDKCSSYGNRNFWVFYQSWFAGTAPDSAGPPPTPLQPPAPPAGPVYDQGGLFVRTPGGTLYWWANTANPTAPYLNRVKVPRGGWKNNDLLTAGDVDHNGSPDMIARQIGGALWLLRNSGNPSNPFPYATKIASSGWGSYDAILAADVDGDSYADLLARSPDGTLRLFRNSHNVANPFPGSGTVVATGLDRLTRLAVGDVNGDGYADLLGTDSAGNLWVYLDTGDPGRPFGTATRIGAGWTAYNALTAVDVDGDGYADLVARGKDGRLWLYLNTQNPASPYSRAPLMIGSGWSSYDRFVGAQVPLPAGSCPLKAPSRFRDVPSLDQFCANIAWLAGSKITTGYADGGFHPAAGISRQAMAAFLFRMRNPGQPAPTCTTAPFRDVPAGSEFCGEITWLKDQRVTGGYADGGFHPTAGISRQAMAAFLHRLTAPGAAGSVATPFRDVSVRSPFRADIAWLAGRNVTGGYSDGGYHPTALVSRQAMAAFLHRLAT